MPWLNIWRAAIYLWCYGANKRNICTGALDYDFYFVVKACYSIKAASTLAASEAEAKAEAEAANLAANAHN